MYLEYLIDETLKRTVNNELINPDTGEINSELTDRAEIALAEIAAVLYKNAPLLTSSQLEQVTTWTKKWKRSKSRRDPAARRDFSDVLEQLRATGDHRRFRPKIIWKLLGGCFFGALALVTIIGFVLSWDDLAWGWGLVFLLVSWFAFSYARRKVYEAIELAQAQDRKYALDSMRKAQSIFELNLAGLFMHMPGTHYKDPGFEGKVAMRTIRVEVERLTDALYNDPDDWLMELEYPWRNEEVTGKD